LDLMSVSNSDKSISVGLENITEVNFL